MKRQIALGLVTFLLAFSAIVASTYAAQANMSAYYEFNSTASLISSTGRFNFSAGAWGLTSGANCAVSTCAIFNANATNTDRVNITDNTVPHPNGVKEWWVSWWSIETTSNTGNIWAQMNVSNGIAMRAQYGCSGGDCVLADGTGGTGAITRGYNTVANKQHWIIQSNSSGTYIYKGGSLTNNSATASNWGTGGFQFGANGVNTNNRLIGSVDEVAIGNGTLNSSQISCIYNSGSGVNWSTTNVCIQGVPPPPPAPPSYNFSITANDNVTGNPLTTFNATISPYPGYVLQEFANVSAGSGTLSTGTYGVEAFFFYINYTVPSGATSSSLWQVKNSNASNQQQIQNLTLAANCWSSSTIQLRGVSNTATSRWECYNHTTAVGWTILYESNGGSATVGSNNQANLYDGDYTTASCYNGGTWKTCTGSSSLYEEAMYWFGLNVTSSSQLLSTTTGLITTTLNQSLGNVYNISIDAGYYFQKNHTNFNTTANLSATLNPLTNVTITDFNLGTPISGATVRFNSTDYTTDSNGHVWLPVITSTYDIQVSATDYLALNFTGLIQNTSVTRSLYQAQVTFTATSLISGSAVTGFTVTNGSLSNSTTPALLYLRAGTYNFTFSKADWYSQSKTVVVSAATNTTTTFSDVYQFLLNVTAQDNINSTPLTSFSVNITSGLYSYEVYGTTTNGSLFFPWINDTGAQAHLFNASSYSNLTQSFSTNISAPALYNLTLLPGFGNTVQFFIRDANTLALVAVNTSITLLGSTVTYNYLTSNGTYLASNVNPDTYVVLINATGYPVTYGLLTNSGEFNNVTYYVDASAQSIAFSVQDTLGNPAPNITISFTRNLNGTVQTIAQVITDFSGLFNVNLNPSIRYSLTGVDPTGFFDTFTGDVQPVYPQTQTYLIKMQFANVQTYPTGLNQTFTFARAVFDNTTSTINVTWRVTNAVGGLSWFALNTTYGGVPYSQNISTISGGGTASVLITGVNLSVQNNINVTFGLQNNGFNAVQFTQGFTFLNVIGGNQTLVGGLLDNAPSGALGKVLLGCFIVFALTAGMFAMSGSRELATLGFIIGTGVVTVPSIGLFPLLYGVITCVVGAVVLVADLVTP